MKKNPALALQGPLDPFRDDPVEFLNHLGEPSGLYSRVKSLLSSHYTAGIFEICDDRNRVMYVIKDGDGWMEIELD